MWFGGDVCVVSCIVVLHLRVCAEFMLCYMLLCVVCCVVVCNVFMCVYMCVFECVVVVVYWLYAR